MTHADISRRFLLGGLAGGAAVAVFAKTPAKAQTPTPAQRAGMFYDRRIGDLTLTTLLDGSFGVQPQMLTGLAAEERARLLRAAYLSVDGPTPVAISAHALRGPQGVTLIDAGAGAFFGPNGGRLLGALAAAGIRAEEVTRIVLTHMHSDHIGGLVGPQGVAFPNATVRVSRAELAFWTDEGLAARAPEIARPSFQRAQAVVRMLGARVEAFGDGEVDLGAGLSTVPMTGHTPGHTGYRIASGADQLIVWGDLTGVAALQFARPETGLVFDVDRERSVATRRRIHDMVAADRIAVAGTHLPFPGIGYVERRGDAYAWTPEEWRYS